MSSRLRQGVLATVLTLSLIGLGAAVFDVHHVWWENDTVQGIQMLSLIGVFYCLLATLLKILNKKKLSEDNSED